MTLTDLETQLANASPSPQTTGHLHLIVTRPTENERRVVEKATLDTIAGLIGDNWYTRGSRHTADGRAHPDMQITLMNSRVIQAIAGDRERWPLAGDQLFVDLDLGEDNLPPGTRLAVGTALLEITTVPHNGCAKFTERYGPAAIRFVNSPEGRRRRRRGVYAKVIQSGTITTGDTITKLDSAG